MYIVQCASLYFFTSLLLLYILLRLFPKPECLACRTTCHASGMYTWLSEDMLHFKWCMFVWQNILPFGFFAMLQVYVFRLLL